MVTGVLLLVLVLLALLLAAFIYQIVITPVTAVDAPTLLKSAAAPDAPAPALPGGLHRIPAAARPAPGTSPPGDSGSQHPWAAALAAIGQDLVGVEAVAGAAYCFDKAFAELSAQIANIHGNHVGLRVEVDAPGHG